MKPFSVKLPDDVEERLKDAAWARSVSRSDLVREAIAEYLVQDPEMPSGSALAAVQDLVGSLEGPEDLSTNPDHLRGYGASRRPRRKA
jgi:hypothetical protein